MENIADKVSEAELAILRVLWDHGGPMSFSQIRAALGEGSGWKTTTIQTLIKRLLDKSALSREQRDVFYYSPAITRRELEKARTEEFVRSVFGGSTKGLLSTLLSNAILSKEDMEELNAFWKARIERDE